MTLKVLSKVWLGPYLAQASLAALALTACEWVAVKLSIDLTSSTGSTMALLFSLWAGYFWCCMVGNALALGLQNLAVRVRFKGTTIMRLGLTAGLCVLVLYAFDTWIQSFHGDEFVERLAIAVGATRAGIVAVLFFGAELAWRRAAPRLALSAEIARVPPFAWHALACLGLAVGYYWVFYQSVAAIHHGRFLGGFAAPVVLIGCGLGGALHELVPRLARAVGVASLGIGLAAPVTAFHNPYARFVVFGHCPVLAALLGPVRDALDIDNDGSVAVWLGGDDCAAFNTAQGPLELEIPGDGLDQDCRGGDAAPPAADPAWVGKELLLTQLGPCALPAAPLSLLLLTVDALRADAIAPEVTPNIARFAAQAMVFQRAYAPATNTQRSLVAMFSGYTLSDFQSPNVHREPDLNFGRPWSAHFAEAGYFTAGFNFLYSVKAIRNAFHEFNVKRTDDLQVPEVKTSFGSAAMTGAVLGVFERGVKRPFFIWAHYPDPHAPYRDSSSAPELPQELRGYLREVAYTDLHLGKLLYAFERAGVMASTIVAITADHGEELGERGIEGHGPYAFDSVIHVPLMVWIPGCGARQFEHPVGTVDLLGNLATVMGVANMARSLGATGTEARPVVAETLHGTQVFLRVVMDEQYKMIVDVRSGGRVLFDLAADPGESRDLYTSRPDLAQRLERRYQEWLDRPGNR